MSDIFSRYAPFVQDFIYKNNWESLRAVQVAAGDVIFNTDDNLLLYGSDTRFNKPGTAEDNWRFRVTKEQLRQIDLKKFRRWNELYARR